MKLLFFTAGVFVVLSFFCTPAVYPSRCTTISGQEVLAERSCVSGRRAEIMPGDSLDPVVDPPAARGPQSPGLPLFAAIRQVESGGNDYAVGDGGRALGPYQCTRAAWQDGCEWLGEGLDYDTYVWDRKATERIMRAYWTRYGADTDEQKCKIWNGGPRGMSKPATESYWLKVRNLMQKEKNNG